MALSKLESELVKLFRQLTIEEQMFELLHISRKIAKKKGENELENAENNEKKLIKEAKNGRKKRLSGGIPVHENLDFSDIAPDENEIDNLFFSDEDIEKIIFSNDELEKIFFGDDEK